MARPTHFPYRDLSDAMTGTGKKRKKGETDIERRNRENQERDSEYERKKRARNEAARLGEKLGKMAGISEPIRNAHTKLYKSK